jgi:asparagine N-glycosylation enzyme membrane subunit Stt3
MTQIDNHKNSITVLGHPLERWNFYSYVLLVHVLGYALSQLLPLAPYDAYHLCGALIGFLGGVAAYRIGSLLGGGRAGFLGALFLILTPRYYGHIFNNPKDIPFAVFYLWRIFWIMRGMGALPTVPRNWIWKTGLAIGLTLGRYSKGFGML